MVFELKHGRPRVLFYCVTERDKIIAESLGKRVSEQITCEYSGLPYGSGLLGLAHALESGKSQSVFLPAGANPCSRSCGPVGNSCARIGRYVNSTNSAAWLTKKYQAISHPPRAFANYRNMARESRSFLRSAAPDLLVLFEEAAEGPTRFMVAAANRCGIPFIVVPQTIPNPKEAAASYADLASHSGSRPLARVIRRFLPQWYFTYKNHLILRLPLGVIFTQYLLRIRQRQPWILNSGKAKKILIECDAFHQLYDRLGFSADQLVVTGHPVDDDLFAASRERYQRRQALERELGFMPNRPLVVVGFPPNQFVRIAAEHRGLRDYDTLCRAWRDGLDILRSRMNVVIRPHPRLLDCDLKILTDSGFMIGWRPTENLIPLADLYVASISATIRWALALGTPVVNYDCYRLDFEDYDTAAGIRVVRSLQQFKALLTGLVSDPKLLEEMKHDAERDRHRWGAIDGAFCDRFSGILSELLPGWRRPASTSHENSVRLYARKAHPHASPILDRAPK
jgi:glycosyltransferase involved in cell wall biosynthesis